MSENATPQLAEVMRQALEARFEGAWISMPARVTEYDADKRVCSAQPLVKQRRVLEDGQEVAEAIPVIPHVPVLFMGGGGFGATFPVAVGDNALLVFASCSLDSWLASKGRAPVDPIDRRRQHLSDAVAICGLQTPAGAAPADPDRAYFGKEGGPGISFGASDMVVEGSGGAAGALSLHSDLVALKNAFSSWTPVAMDGGAALKSLLTTLIGTGWPHGTSILKGK